MNSLPELVGFELDAGSAIPARLIEQARREAAAIGYAQGWSHGLREARESRFEDVAAARKAQGQFETDRDARLANALNALAGAAEQLEHAAVPAARLIEDQIVHAAVELAQALLGRELRNADVPAQAALGRVLGLAPQGEPVIVHLNPADHQAVYAAASELAERTRRSITLVADPSVQVGDAIGHSGATTIDARLAEGLRRLVEELAI
jgi:flagellar assembly protein FliH